MNYPKMQSFKMPSPVISQEELKPSSNIKLIKFVCSDSLDTKTNQYIESDKSVSDNRVDVDFKKAELNLLSGSPQDRNPREIPEEHLKESLGQQEDKNKAFEDKVAAMKGRVISFINLVPETVAQVKKIDDSFSQEAEDERPLVHLKELETILFKIFKGDKLTVTDFRLSLPELHILVEVLIRKYKGSPNRK